MSKKSDELVHDLIDLLNGETAALKEKYGEKLVDEISEIAATDPKVLQKKYQDEAYNAYLKKFASTVHLWQLKDKQWLANRKAVWEKIIAREKE
ncbi:MAG: hypothetical protein AAF387_21515 [Pseudomonadota bacterium]